jgi:hypothetical protein
MAEEVKEVQGEAQPGASAPASERKNQKINRLTVDAIAGKIKELEEKNQTNSKYYQHLILRKKELDGAGN